MSLKETIITTAKWVIVGFALTVGGAGVLEALNATPTNYKRLADSLDLIGDGLEMAEQLLTFIQPLI